MEQKVSQINLDYHAFMEMSNQALELRSQGIHRNCFKKFPEDAEGYAQCMLTSEKAATKRFVETKLRQKFVNNMLHNCLQLLSTSRDPNDSSFKSCYDRLKSHQEKIIEHINE
eukprot:TRINITY_DN10651_c0_g1_i2.p1 TRINITY_DN10651_c0_g1~~TRINITY_DN10651_c0_g1_i2.p1  ORF type:complete len:113 (+),score=11.12 TRINITY_DN10651_c0_g1_i2:107-445(+)